MVFGLGRKKDEAAAQTQAPQMSPAAMEMLQQAATGAPAAGQAMAPSMTPGMEQAPPTAMAPSMAQPAAAAAFPPAGAAEMPSFTPTPDAALASGRTAKPSREEKKAAAAAQKEMKLLEKRRKKGSKARFSRARYLREANGNAAAALASNLVVVCSKVMPADHPDTAAAKLNLAITGGALGRHKDAMSLQVEIVAFRERVIKLDICAE